MNGDRHIVFVFRDVFSLPKINSSLFVFTSNELLRRLLENERKLSSSVVATSGHVCTLFVCQNARNAQTDAHTLWDEHILYIHKAYIVYARKCSKQSSDLMQIQYYLDLMARACL